MLVVWRSCHGGHIIKDTVHKIDQQMLIKQKKNFGRRICNKDKKGQMKTACEEVTIIKNCKTLEKTQIQNKELQKRRPCHLSEVLGSFPLTYLRRRPQKYEINTVLRKTSRYNKS